MFTVNTPSSQTCGESHCSKRNRRDDSLTFLFYKASFRSASVKWCHVETRLGLLGHLGLHSLRRPLRCCLTDLLQQVVHLEAERLDLFVPGGQRLSSWPERKHRALSLLKLQRYREQQRGLEMIGLTLKVDDAIYLVDEAVHTTLCDHLGGDFLSLIRHTRSLIKSTLLTAI